MTLLLKIKIFPLFQQCSNNLIDVYVKIKMFHNIHFPVQGRIPSFCTFPRNRRENSDPEVYTQEPASSYKLPEGP